MKKFLNNFIVLSTDYENYAIVYQCTYKTVMYNKDIVTILLRDPEFTKLQSNTMDTIKSEFARLFGEKEQEEEEEVEEDATDEETKGIFKEDEDQNSETSDTAEKEKPVPTPAKDKEDKLKSESE